MRYLVLGLFDLTDSRYVRTEAGLLVASLTWQLGDFDLAGLSFSDRDARHTG